MIRLKLRKVIDNYIECNNFEIKIVDRKVKVYYYGNIESFTSSVIVISKDEDVVKIKGKNLVIETMFPEYVVISGNIKSLELGNNE